MSDGILCSCRYGLRVHKRGKSQVLAATGNLREPITLQKKEGLARPEIGAGGSRWCLKAAVSIVAGGAGRVSRVKGTIWSECQTGTGLAVMRLSPGSCMDWPV